MDRNLITLGGFAAGSWVALRKESVDRNRKLPIRLPTALVALRKESVDRNTLTIIICIASKKSLSARRAWIEIPSSKYAL